MDWVPETWVLEVPWRNGFKASWTKAVFHFFYQIIGIFNNFSKWSLSKALWKIITHCDMLKIWQKMKKSLVQLAIKPLFGWCQVPENLISGNRSITKYNLFSYLYLFTGQALCGTCRDETHRAKMFSKHDIIHMSMKTKENAKKVSTIYI